MTRLSFFADPVRFPTSWCAPKRSDWCGRGSINRIAWERPLPAKSPKSIPFEIIRIGKKGVTLGRVYAATEEEAHAAAVIEFKIDPAKVRLMVRPA
jgi:hypothetical protein